MQNPYFMREETIVSFSGGRTSGYMLRHILDAHGGSLPEHVKVCFANTGKEREETLDFVQECATRWNVPIIWLEYDPTEDTKVRVCGHNSASRNGEPFAAVIDARSFLPNPVARFCTTEMKIRTIKRYAMQHLGWEHWQNAVGLRADEPSRVAKARHQRERWDTITPLATAQVTKRDVAWFWQQQPFDLRLPNVNGKTPHGNCDLCFLKGASLIAGLIRNDPASADWWITQEQRLVGKTTTFAAARFRSDRPSYAEIKQAVLDQTDAFDHTEPLQECYCHD